MDSTIPFIMFSSALDSLKDGWNKTNSVVGKLGFLLFYGYFLLCLVSWLANVVTSQTYQNCSILDDDSDDAFYLSQIIQVFSITSAALSGYVLVLGPTRNNLCGIVLIYGLSAWAFSTGIPETISEQVCFQDVQSAFWFNASVPFLTLLLIGYDAHAVKRSNTGDEQSLLV